MSFGFGLDSTFVEVWWPTVFPASLFDTSLSPVKKLPLVKGMANAAGPRWVERKFLGWTCGLVMLLGAPVFYSFVSQSGLVNEKELVELEISKQKKQTEIANELGGGGQSSANKSSAGRIPASSAVLDSNSNAVDESSAPSDYKLPCSVEKLTSASVQTAQTALQFSGGNCFTQELDLRIKNTANGYTASVIFQAEGGFTTDFIPLEIGTNRFEFQSSSGRHQENIISSHPASSK